MQFALLIVGLLAASELGSCDFAAESNALHDVIHHLYGPFSGSTHLMQTTLKPLYEEVFEKAECAEKSSNCSECLNSLISVFIPEEIETLAEWNNASEVMLYGILDMPTFCNMTLEEMESLNVTNALLGVLGVEPSGSVGEEEIEELLELLHDGFSGEEHHEEEAAAGGSEVAAAEDDDHHDEEDEHDHETTRCFGEGTLLYYLGLDHEESLESGRVPEMAGILISYLVQDWIVADVCEVIPKKADVLNALFESLGNTSGTLSEEGFEMLLEQLNIGSVAGAPTVAPDDGHNHKRSISSLTRFRRDADEEAITSQREEVQPLSTMAQNNVLVEYGQDLVASSCDFLAIACMGEATLAAIYDLDIHNGISQDEFLSLCPALIQQQISGSCEPVVNTTTPPSGDDGPTTAEIYGYGTLAVIIISGLSLLGAVLIPFLHTIAIKYVLGFFVAMGIGTMLGDALLHLIPQALGLHAHGEEEGAAEEEGHAVGPTLTNTVALQLISCVAIYCFWLFESFMLYFRPASANRVSHGHSHTTGEKTPTKVFVTPSETSSESGESKTPVCGKSDDSKEENDGSIPALALMILIGDGLHNFIDGIAIGAAFSTSLEDGLGTSIAIFCHELPHELGDFSVLLKIGVSKVKAILFNLLSASMCLFGLFIGGAVSSANEGARQYLLALTAGMFIYVALVDMMPELMQPNKEGKWYIHFILHNIGMILGFSLMLIIAVFEEALLHM
ncbi:zinc transporter ZIP4-like [Watersipora subatra]|uniref:zinc transporter ZIP4-like n=1 Tax=Watersipora subatra TaxID=2589382 RepID=UPI00355C5A80